MTRSLSLVAALALSLSPLASCKKDSKGEAAAGDEAAKVQEPAVATEVEAEPVADKVEPTGDVVIAPVPEDTFTRLGGADFVIAISPASLVKVPLWAAVEPLLEEKVKLGELAKGCGFNPLAKLSSVVVGMPADDKGNPIMVLNGMSRDDFEACARAFASRDNHKVEMRQDGAFTTMLVDGKGTTMVAWPEKTQAVLYPGAPVDDATHKRLADRLIGKDSIKSNAALMKLVGEAQQDQPIWFAGLLGEESAAKAQMAALGVEVAESLRGSISISDHLVLSLVFKFKSEDEAKKLAQKLKMFLPMIGAQSPELKKLLDKLVMASSGPEFTLTLDLSDDDMVHLQKNAGSAFGGLF